MPPGTASIPTHTSDVATARLRFSPRISVKAGTITVPPPMPRIPDTRPAPAPVRLMTSGRGHALGAPASRGGSPPAGCASRVQVGTRSASMRTQASPTGHVVALAFAYGLLLTVPALSPRLWSLIAFHSPSLQIALETITGLASLLFCYIAYGRFLHTRLL